MASLVSLIYFQINKKYPRKKKRNVKKMNLLPKEYLFDLKLNQLLHRIIAVFAIIFLSIVLISGYIRTAALTFEEHIAILNNKIYSEQYVLSEALFEDQRRLTEELQEREALTAALYTEQRITKEQFYKIFIGLPEDTKVSEIKMNNANGEISFTGIAQDNQSVILYSNWITRHFSIPQITLLTTSQDGKRKFTLEWGLPDD